ncbi:alpha-E domain-containing protein [Formosa sp. PL04]|uniref:alpha-E domain-containing protein n=1 Tax=Formosa sp. PL04 TaxID=3081755 RepID=UPI00298245AC|nr:alpha-E domain-containing protein [Formosa sp. PL04]MDW5289112.1 alpha-E domain-containing protein [Formosa sp. PL04]
MLARIANNLFWMGRYIERAEHTARFTNVNYFSSLDAPNKLSRDRQFVLRAIYEMVGEEDEDDEVLVEEEVLFNIALNSEKHYSILKCISYARENANSSRDLISNDFYESINKFYHSVMNYSKEHFVTRGLHDFTSHVMHQTTILKGKIRGTMLHDEVYALIKLGVNIERATQVTRILQIKYNDAEQVTLGKPKQLKKSFEWTTLLKCVDSFDINRRVYRRPPVQVTVLEFLMLNPCSPRTVLYCLNEIQTHITMLDPLIAHKKNTATFLIGKMRSEYKYKTVEDIQGDVKEFIAHTLDSLVEISEMLEDEYFYH